MVCTPLCNPYLFYDHRTNVFDSSLAPHGAGRLHTCNAHILWPHPHPGYPAPDLTTTYLNSHDICTDPQLLIDERPEAYQAIQGVMPDVEEKRIAEGETICDKQY